MNAERENENWFISSKRKKLEINLILDENLFLALLKQLRKQISLDWIEICFSLFWKGKSHFSPWTSLCQSFELERESFSFSFFEFREEENKRKPNENVMKVQRRKAWKELKIIKHHPWSAASNLIKLFPISLLLSNHVRKRRRRGNELRTRIMSEA